MSLWLNANSMLHLCHDDDWSIQCWSKLGARVQNIQKVEKVSIGLVARLHPVFRCLQYGKGESLGTRLAITHSSRWWACARNMSQTLTTSYFHWNWRHTHTHTHTQSKNSEQQAVTRNQTPGLSHPVFCHWATTTRQPPTLTILHLYKFISILFFLYK